MVMDRGCIPNDDLHKTLSEGEGACSENCDGRSHLPLRGKLGWMTPRPGQKKTGKRNASLGLSFPSESPFPIPSKHEVYGRSAILFQSRQPSRSQLFIACRCCFQVLCPPSRDIASSTVSSPG